MRLKKAALLSLIGTTLMTILMVWTFVSNVLNAMRGLVPGVRLFSSLIYAFGVSARPAAADRPEVSCAAQLHRGKLAADRTTGVPWRCHARGRAEISLALALMRAGLGLGECRAAPAHAMLHAPAGVVSDAALTKS